MSDTTRNPVFRATGLPASQPDDELKSALVAVINNNLSKDEQSTIDVRAAIVPSCYDHDRERVALVEFRGGLPAFLAKLTANPLDSWQVEMGDADVNFDRHFFGFTQLYMPKADTPVTADVIAITGLDGHAYGSWRGKGDLGRMWLRDFLSRDLPCCRTMIYGYNSKLSSRGDHTIMDYGRELLEEIRKVRNTEELWQRPLFFIAHSFGGIILVHSLVKAAHSNEGEYPAIAAVYKATYGMLLFATPHKGLVVSDIRKMLEGQSEHPRNALLGQIDQESNKLLDHQLDAFKNVIRDRKIASFYERGQTRQLEYNSESQRWQRTGDYVTAMSTDSALLQLPDSVEEKIPLNADHSMIVKFDARIDAGYTSARDKLRQFEANAPGVVASRFLPAESRLKPSALVAEPTGNVHWMVPRKVNSLFTGRSELIHRIRSALCFNQVMQTQEQRRFVITGMGGQGKSEVCLEVANLMREEFWGVFWVDVHTPSTAKNGFVAITKALSSPAESIDDSLQALASTKRRWLLVLDNADDPEFDYAAYMPSGNQGAVLITSRVPECSQYSTHGWEALEGLNLQHSTQLLLKAARVSKASWSSCERQAQDVVRLLGSHTLALIQAGAYVAGKYCQLEQYPAKYQQQRKRMLKHHPKQEQSRYLHVYATFEASIAVLHNAEETGNDAIDLLAVLSMLHSSVLPLQVFEYAWTGARHVLQDKDAGTSEIDASRPWHVERLPDFVDVQKDKWDDYRLRRASNLLVSLSLVTTSYASDNLDGLSMHPLAHAWAKDRLQGEQQEAAWVRAGCLLSLSQGQPETWRMYEKELRPHVQSYLSPAMAAVFSYAPRELILPAVLQCGWILNVMREDTRLERLLQDIYQELQVTPSKPSREHMPIWDLAARNMRHMGDSRQAAALLEHVVEVRKTTLAESHPLRLASQLELALAYRANGQTIEAAALLEHVVKVRKTTLAESHPNQLASQHELALAYYANRQTTEAVALLEHVVIVKETTLAESHPSRLASQHGLAVAYYANRQITEAVALLEHVVKVSKTTLAESHPDQLASQHALALAYYTNRQTTEAVALLEAVVAVKSRVLRGDHPLRRVSIEVLQHMYTALA